MTQKDKIFVKEIEEEIARLKVPISEGVTTQWETTKTREHIHGLQEALDIFLGIQNDDYDEDWI